MSDAEKRQSNAIVWISAAGILINVLFGVFWFGSSLADKADKADLAGKADQATVTAMQTSFQSALKSATEKADEERKDIKQEFADHRAMQAQSSGAIEAKLEALGKQLERVENKLDAKQNQGG